MRATPDDDSGRMVERLGALLDSVDLSQYYGARGVIDEVIAEVLAALADGPPAGWDALVDSLTEQRRRVLGRYAVRAPMLALRSGDARYLLAGLLAHGALTRTVTDWRDDLILFAPYAHTAQVLNVDVPALFDAAAAHAVADLAQVMQRFGRRTDVTLGAFGWRSVETADGPTFESMMMGGAPTGAVVGERSWNEVNEALARALLDWVKEQRDRS